MHLYPVAPLVGAWIERMRKIQKFMVQIVAPLVGAWIESLLLRFTNPFNFVAPLVGAWIERQKKHNIKVVTRSLLL